MQTEEEWKAKAQETYMEVEKLCGWVEGEVRNIDFQTASLIGEKIEIKADILELQKKIAEEEDKQVEEDDLREIEELKQTKKQNQSQIQELKKQIELKRFKAQHLKEKTIQNRQISKTFDKHVQRYKKLQEIYVLMQQKSKIKSQMLMSLGRQNDIN